MRIPLLLLASAQLAAAETPPVKKSDLATQLGKRLAGSCTQAEFKECVKMPAADCEKAFAPLVETCASSAELKAFPDVLAGDKILAYGMHLGTCSWRGFLEGARAKGQAVKSPSCDGLFALLSHESTQKAALEPAKEKPAAAPAGGKKPVEYMLEGSVRFDAGDMEGARSFYEKALAANETQKQLQGEPLAMLYSDLADCHFFANRFPEAIELMKKALATAKMDPRKEAHNHFNLACAYSELGKTADAAAQLRATLAGVKGVPELATKYDGMARTDEQLAKLRASGDYAALKKEFGL